MTFNRVLVIYNPNSTGDSERLAKIFAKKARKLYPKASVELVPTKFVAHGEEIAAKAASMPGKTLIVSSSGDGGYHEVINGLMAGKRLLSNVTSAVLPAGNANDHSRTMHDSPLHRSLKKAEQIKIDLLKITVKQDNKVTTRYAHSYAGLGFTPQVARELNKHQLNPAKELGLLLKTFKDFEPFKIEHDNKIQSYDSLVFSNINQMAKVLTLADKNRPDDGKFELIAMQHRSKVKMLLTFVKAAVTYIQPEKRLKKFEFRVLHAMPFQLDGEVMKLEKDAKVVVSIAPRALKTLV